MSCSMSIRSICIMPAPAHLFVQQAAHELGAAEEMLSGELGRVLLKLEQVQDEAIRKAQEPADTSACRK